MSLVGVILAGGASRRFGADKLRAGMDGVPLISYVARALGEVASEVRVSVESETHARALLPFVPATVRTVIDREAFRGIGPLAGIASSLLEMEGADALFVPGDMPWVSAAALSRLVTTARKARLDVAAPLQADGFVDTLVLYVRAGGSVRLLSSLDSSRTLPPRSSDVIRAAGRAGLVPRALLSPSPDDFVNVNTPGELVRGTSHERMGTGARPAARAREQVEGTATGPVILPPAASRAYWKAQGLLARGEPASAVAPFVKEAALHQRRGIALLAYHALTDAILASDSAGGEDPALETRRRALKRGWSTEGRP